jgi:hypothetical protein
MKVIAPISITEAMLTSSTLLPEAEAVWSAGTGYAKGARVRKTTHVVWESVKTGTNTGIDPATDDGTNWVLVGPTNAWAMFDGSVSTASTAATTIEVGLTPGMIVDAGAVIAGVGDTVRWQMHDGATQVYDATKSLDSTPIESWEDYFFADFALAGELIFEGLPAYLSATATVTITPSSGEAAAGAVVLGRMHYLGETLPGAAAGITDYSRKETDTFGATSLVQRSFAKRMQVRLLLETSQTKRVQAVLASLRATPAVWIGDDDTDTFGPLVVYGWFKSFSIDIPGPVYSYCTLEIEGLT